MPVTLGFDSLTAEEQTAVAAFAPEGETVADYLTRIGAGQNTVDGYVARYRAQKQARMAAAVPALLDAGIDPQMVVDLARGFAAASADVRAQVVRLLT